MGRAGISGRPSLKVDRNEIDLRDIPFERSVGASFEVTNEGNRPLKFNKTPYVEVVEGC
jgi:hypothetical protein